MYPWITHTWNPLGGKCLHGCTYCSTNKLAAQYPVIKKKYSGPIRLEEKELKTNLKSGNFIFVCAQNDLFAEGVQEDFVNRIIEHCKKFDNRYLLQTKNPKGLFKYYFPENFEFCVTMETNRWYPDIMKNCPHPVKRASYMNSLYVWNKSYITVEPIMDFDLGIFVRLIKQCSPIQVNIGADSGNKNLPEPPKEKVIELIEKLKAFTRVELKSNLKRIIQ